MVEVAAMNDLSSCDKALQEVPGSSLCGWEASSSRPSRDLECCYSIELVRLKSRHVLFSAQPPINQTSLLNLYVCCQQSLTSVSIPVDPQP